MATFKVYAAGTAMVSDYEALASNVRRYVGRVYDPAIGVAGGWVPKKEAQVVPDRAEYRQAIKEGDLLAADQATASACNVALHKTS